MSQQNNQIKILKLKLPMPMDLEKKLRSVCLASGRKIEDVVVFMIDNEIKSVEKFEGEIPVAR